MHDLIRNDLEHIIDGVGLEELKQLEGKSVFISGSCGFLGSWFIALFQELNTHYFEKPVTVFGVDSFIAADKYNEIVDVVDPNIFLKEQDVSTMTFSPTETFDYIIHAAGIASPIYYRKYPIETIDGMLFGLRSLLNFAVSHPVKSFLNFSSSEMYGNPSDDMVPTPETYNGNVSCIGPRSCYDESKRMGETLCHVYANQHNVPLKWVRPFNVYGPGMRITDDRVVPKFMYQILQGKDVTIHLPGLQTRTFCYISDAMIGFIKTLLIGKNDNVYNIGACCPEISMIDLAKLMVESFGKETGSELIQVEMPQEYPTDQAQRRCPSIQKAKDDLGYEPRVNLGPGLVNMREWCSYILSEQKRNA